MAWWTRGADEGQEEPRREELLPASEELFDTWVAEMDPKLSGFEMLGLPAQFTARHYSRDALAQLQDVIRSRLSTAKQVSDGFETAFVDGAVRYIGQTLIRHVGGRWHYTAEQGVPWRGRPVLVLDHPASSEDDPVDVLGLVRETVRAPRYDWLTDAFDIHVRAAREHTATQPPAQEQPTPEPGSRLEGWLATMDEQLDAWAHGPAAPAYRWDHSLQSLDQLADWALQHFPIGEDPRKLDEPLRTDLENAARYLGATLLRHHGGAWRYSEAEPSRTNPFKGQAAVTREDPETRSPVAVVPMLALAGTVARDDPGILAGQVSSYGNAPVSGRTDGPPVGSRRMTLEERARAVRTVPELRAFLTVLGRNPEAIGYLHDRNQRKDSGEILLKQLADGSWEAAAHERGNVIGARRFATEQEAVRTLALEQLESHRRTPVSTITPEELAEIDRTRPARRTHFTEQARRARKKRWSR